MSGANSFVVSLTSFLRSTPSKENIRAITAVEGFVLNKADMDKLNREHEVFRFFYTNMLEHLVTCIDDSRFKLMTYTAEQRYMAMLKEEPELLKQVPLQYLASILGVTPRHLSRIRASIT